MKLFCVVCVNNGVLTYFKDVFLVGRHLCCPTFFLCLVIVSCYSVL